MYMLIPYDPLPRFLFFPLLSDQRRTMAPGCGSGRFKQLVTVDPYISGTSFPLMGEGARSTPMSTNKPQTDFALVYCIGYVFRTMEIIILFLHHYYLL